MVSDGKEHSWYSRLVAFVSGRFVAGLIVLIPVAITIVILQFVFNFLDDFLGPGIESLAGRNLPGVGLLALILLIFVVGLFAMSRFIRGAIGRMETQVMRLPGIGTIYSIGKKMTDSFSGTGTGEGFGRVVVVEYPRDSVWSLGFLTGFTQLDSVLHAFVYLPTAPMPNSGWIAVIDATRVYDTDVSPQEAMQAVLSSGLANPDAINRSALPESASSPDH